MMRELPIYKLIVWMLSVPQLIFSMLVLILLVSCFAVSYASFETRQKYSELQKLNAERDSLDSEYEKLLLEQSAWAGYARIDEVSREQLDMRIPSGDQIVVVSK